MATVFDVAEYILVKLQHVTTMKLQKLVYYCQAWSLVWDEKPLFNEDFEAWANGPVCPELFNKHRGYFELTADSFKDHANYPFTESERETMDAVLEHYGDKSPQWLIDLTHIEEPWKLARKGLQPGEPGHTIISKESMQDYYGGLEHAQQA